MWSKLTYSVLKLQTSCNDLLDNSDWGEMHVACYTFIIIYLKCILKSNRHSDILILNIKDAV